MTNSMISRAMRATAITALLLAGACKSLDVPDYYAGDQASLTGGAATRTGVLTALQGMPIGTRLVMSNIVATFGEIGREGYSLDPTNPDANARLLVAPSRALGSTTWSNGYQAIRQGYIVLHALDALAGMTDQEKSACKGFAKTLMAIDLLSIIEVFDQTGAAVAVDVSPDAPLPPLVSKAAVYTEIHRLLNDGRSDLVAAGTLAFPFTASPGFTGFTTADTFIKVNRAISARVDAYEQNWAAALTDLAASFMDTTAALNLGAYNSYSTNAGDLVDPLYDPLPRTLVAIPTIITDAQLRGDGSPDLRATQKTAPMTPRTLNNITVVLKWNIYKSAGDPFPIIRNEDLILLRAEAELACTGVYPSITCSGNRANALAYVNFIRVKSGGLNPIADPGVGGAKSGDRLLDEILYNRQYSLIWEGGHRWLDMRRYGLLAQLPRARPGDIVVPYAALPDAECIPRGNPSVCTLPPNL